MSGSIAAMPAGLILDMFAQAPFSLSKNTLAGVSAITGGVVGWSAAKLFALLQASLGDKHRHNDAPAHQREPETEAELLQPLQVAELEELQSGGEPEEPAIEAEIADYEKAFADDPQACFPEAETFAAEAQAIAASDDNPASDMISAPDVIADTDLAAEIALEPEVIAVAPEETNEPLQANPALAPRHGKAVHLLRERETRDLAMPQLIERFAVALEDYKSARTHAAHSYSRPAPPRHLTAQLDALIR